MQCHAGARLDCIKGIEMYRLHGLLTHIRLLAWGWRSRIFLITCDLLCFAWWISSYRDTPGERCHLAEEKKYAHRIWERMQVKNYAYNSILLGISRCMVVLLIWIKVCEWRLWWCKEEQRVTINNFIYI